jgi:hypothetical protein
MSYICDNTPSPTTADQIGYSYTTTLNTASSTNSGTQATTTISNVPIGVWIVTCNVLGAKPSNELGTIQTACTVTLVGTGTIARAGHYDEQGYNYYYAPCTGVFYSDGTASITVQLTAGTNSGTSNTSGTCTLTKIA